MTEPPAEFEVPSDKDAILSTPSGRSQHIMLTANCYDDSTRQPYDGALIEETSAFRSDVELFYNLHTLIWDPELGETYDNRNDAAGSDVDWASGEVPELTLSNDFEFSDGTDSRLEQDVVASTNQCSILIRNRADFEVARDRTCYTIANLGIKGHSHEDPNAIQAAHVRNESDHDVLTATDGSRHVAFAQARDGYRRFDGSRVGHTGQQSGPDRSAWTDVYVENDGWIDNHSAETGDLDAGFGLYADNTDSVEWLTAVGFATKNEEKAVEHAVSALDNGYETERAAFADAWEAWHENSTTKPTGEPVVDDLYARSLTSLKCAEDHCQAMIAGAFKPSGMTYKFIWPRDQVIIIQALLAAGAIDEVIDSLEWLDEVQIRGENPIEDDRGIDRRGTWWQNYYTTGEPHWEALQLDQVGGPIYAHWLAWHETGDDVLLEKHYEMSERAAEFLLSWDNGWGFPEKHQDPWEEVWGHSTEGSASGIAGLRCMAELAEAVGDEEFAQRCRERADTWASNLVPYCYKENTPYGDHFVTADSPEYGHPSPDQRPDAAAFMAYWPWNVVAADADEMVSTAELADDPAWRADETPCVGRYPEDSYTPSGTAEDGGWPLCEAYADMVRWQSGIDSDAVTDHIEAHASEWTTSADLLPERVDGDGTVSWNSNLQWSQAMYILLVESHRRGEPYGLAPAE